MSCIFCKIIAGEIESSKVYEDDQVLAFMDIQPIREGQVVVIPKEHIDHFSDLPEARAVQVFSIAHRISKIIKEKIACERVGFVVNGYGVAHAHMIVVPQQGANDITSGRMAAIEDGQVVFTMQNLPTIARKELDATAQIIRSAL